MINGIVQVGTYFRTRHGRTAYVISEACMGFAVLVDDQGDGKYLLNLWTNKYGNYTAPNQNGKYRYDLIKEIKKPKHKYNNIYNSLLEVKYD